MTVSSPARTSRPRIEYLDAIRALAALYVMLGHIWGEMLARPVPHSLSPLARVAIGWVRGAHYAVAVFIVLSGYVLMLPVVNSPEGKLRGGFLAYIGRRAKRILPPYYAALGLTLLMVYCVPSMHAVQGGVWWDIAQPIIPKTVLLHVLLLHNFRQWAIFSVNPPMWSVATEWQIYFLFPLLLLPLRRRVGLLAPIVMGYLLGLAITFYRPTLYDACFWYIGLFAMGMAAASVNFSDRPASRRIEQWHGWLPLSGAVLLGFCVIGAVRQEWIQDGYRTMDFLAGVACAGMLIACTRAKREGQSLPLLRLLEARPLVALGAFSYSLYLIHQPLLSLAHLAMRRLHLSEDIRLLGLVFLAAPCIVAAAYLFHLAFERPFMPGRPKTEAQAETAAAISPAP